MKSTTSLFVPTDRKELIHKIRAIEGCTRSEAARQIDEVVRFCEAHLLGKYIGPTARGRSRRGRPTMAALSLFPYPHQNHLLDALSGKDLDRLAPNLERIAMKLGDVLYEPGGRLSHVYFPTTCIISLLYAMQDGASAEIALVGNDGILGVSLFMGGNTTPSRAVVQSAGYAFRLEARLLKEEFARSGATMNLLLRYTQALITQMAQTVVCNRHHSVDQQLCRWLLLSFDRLPSNELAMTQKLIADMLGVRREGVTQAAGNLQTAGLISYGRGRISLVDRPGLEARCCECYEAVKRESDRLLPHVAR